MTKAELCADIMSVLWGDTSPVSPIVHACASHVKTHRTNCDNVFDVLAVIFPDEARVTHVRDADPVRSGDVPDQTLMVATVMFIDGSSAVVECVNGIGQSCEVLP